MFLEAVSRVVILRHLLQPVVCLVLRLAVLLLLLLVVVVVARRRFLQIIILHR